MGDPITWLVDISNWQGDIDIARIASEGYSACVCKATEGTTYDDATFDRDIPLVKAAGMIPGAYHFLRAGDGAAQARKFFGRVQAHGGPGGWLIQLDAEKDGYGAEMTDWANEWNRLSGRYPFLIYSGGWWWPRTNGFRGVDLTPYLWHSHYVDGVDYGSVLYEDVSADFWTPGYGGWGEATLLQFSDKARVAGAEIDVSAFRGSVDQLRAALTRPGGAPTPPPSPAPAGRPAPGPALGFPLPAGWYFGPASGPDSSVSGLYQRWFNGRTDRQWIQEWANQLARRGWSVGKGQRWLGRYGNDGIYGDEYAALISAFQADQHLDVDALLGVNTWDAAYRNPVT